MSFLLFFYCACSLLRAQAADPRLTAVETFKSYSLSRLTLPSSVISTFPSNDTVYVDIFLPLECSGAYPVVIVLPGLAEPTKWVEYQFCKSLAKNGIAAFFIELPYQFHRKPNQWVPSGRLFLSYKPEKILKNYKQAVRDISSIISWISQNKAFDEERIGILGISLGSLIGLTAMGDDTRIKKGIFLLGGVGLDEIIWKGSLTRKIIKELKKDGITQETLQKVWKPIEPALRLQNLKNRPVDLYNARWDKVLPKKSIRRLWDGLPHADTHWLIGGHYTAIINMFWLPRSAAKKFKIFFGN